MEYLKWRVTCQLPRTSSYNLFVAVDNRVRGLVLGWLSYSQYFLHNLMDMGSSLRNVIRTILNYQRETYVQP